MRNVKATQRVKEKKLARNFVLPSLIRFFRPSVPILSQNVSSFSSFRAVIVGRGDLGLGEAMLMLLGLTAIELCLAGPCEPSTGRQTPTFRI